MTKKKKPKVTPKNFKDFKREKPKPLWNLYTDGVTQSLIGAFEECPEQMALRYIDGYSSRRLSEPLEFGSIMHYCLEYQFKFHNPEECVDQVTEQYKIHREKSIRNSADRDTLEYLIELARITFPPYCHYWHEDDQQIEWLVREGKFSVPYDVETEKGLVPINLRGMRDGLYRDSQGRLGVFETKNKKRISEQEIKDGLHADMQTLFYCFVTYLETGECPTRVKYNVIRKADIYRRDKGKESLSSLMKRITDDIKKRPSHYFMRFNVELLESDIRKFRDYTLNPLLHRLIVWYDSIKKNPIEGRNQSPYHYRSLRNLIGKYGKSDLWELIVNGNRTFYNMRTEVFPELSDSFQAITSDKNLSTKEPNGKSHPRKARTIHANHKKVKAKT